MVVEGWWPLSPCQEDPNPTDGPKPPSASSSRKSALELVGWVSFSSTSLMEIECMRPGELRDTAYKPPTS